MSTAETLYYRCIPRLVTHDRDLPRDARYLFVMIAEEAHLDTGRVQMTTEYLADISDMSISTVLRNLPLLEAKGYLRVIRARKGSKIANIYEIIGAAAEVVIRKGKAEVGQSTASRQVSESQSTPKQATQRQSATLKSRVAVGESSALNRPTDSCPPAPTAVDNPPETPSTSLQLPERLSQSQLTKEQEQKSESIEEDVVIDDHSTPLFQLDGMAPHVMQTLVQHYGDWRVWQVLEQAQKKKKSIANLPGWVCKALEQDWQFGNAARKNQQQGYQRYLTGRYAEFIKT
jgi:hypothetical protein